MTDTPYVYRTGRKVPNTIYAQMGPEPSDSDVFIGSAVTGFDARVIVRYANLGIAPANGHKQNSKATS